MFQQESFQKYYNTVNFTHSYEKLRIFFKIQSGNKNMLQNLIGSKYWKIWKILIIFTIILMENGKKLKQLRKQNNS